MKRRREIEPAWTTALEDLELVHPEIAAALPRGAEWRYEIKYDGFRAAAELANRTPRLRYRRAVDGAGPTAAWPEVVGALAALGVDQAVFDGELVVPDKEGHPRFDLVQGRASHRGPGAVKAAREHPGVYCVFDVLALHGRDLRRQPYEERKAELRRIFRGVTPPLLFVDDCGGDLADLLFARSREAGEGVVAKRRDAPYRPGSWLKVKHNLTDDFVVIGYSEADGALHLAVYVRGVLSPVGRVRAGFPKGTFHRITQALEQIAVANPPCAITGVDAAETWVEPRVVVEVAFVELTRHGVLRHAEFVRVRSDKTPTDCQLSALGHEAVATTTRTVDKASQSRSRWRRRR